MITNIQITCAAIFLSLVFNVSCEYSEDKSELITILYEVTPLSVSTPSSDEIFPTKRPAISEDILKAGGITFPAGSNVITGLDFSGFGMRNTEENHLKLQGWLTKNFAGGWDIKE